MRMTNGLKEAKDHDYSSNRLSDYSKKQLRDSSNNQSKRKYRGINLWMKLTENGLAPKL